MQRCSLSTIGPSRRGAKNRSGESGSKRKGTFGGDKLKREGEGMGTELINRGTGEITEVQITSEQIELIKKTVAQGATPEELQLYFFDCRRRGVHPLDKLIHFTKRKGKYTPITSIDFMRMTAAETGDYAGNDDPAFETA